MLTHSDVSTTTPLAKRVLIVEDHPLLRRALRQTIDGQPDLTVCGEAEDAGPAFTLVSARLPDLVTVDLTLKSSSGLELIKNLHSRYPKLRILVISMYEEGQYAERCLRAGASGYLNKGADVALTLHAIRTVLTARLFVSTNLAAEFLTRRAGLTEVDDDPVLSKLSDREMEVFVSMGQGRDTREIASILRISPHTVDNLCVRIREKLGFVNVRRLVIYAAQWLQDSKRTPDRSLN